MAPLQHTDVEAVVNQLKNSVGPQRWQVWFHESTDFHVTPDALVVGVANLFIGDYLKSHFAAHFDAATTSLFGRTLPVKYHVQPDLFQKRRQKNLVDEAQAADQLAGPALQPQGCPSPQQPPETRPLFSLENFVVGPCNHMAHAAALAAAAAPGKDFHPLFIHGGCGVGKTHLLHGTLHALCRRRGLNVACVSAEQFTNQFLAGMRTNRLDAFRHRYRHLDVLAIDDVHFLSGKPSTQEEFLHTFNEFDSRGRLVILASDSHPREIDAIQDRLVSRWVSGLVVRMGMPDLATRKRILEAKAVEMGHPLPADVIAHMAERIQGSVRDLEGSLTRIIATAAILKTPATVELARQALADYVPTAPGRVTMDQVEETIATFFGVTRSDIHSARRSHQISLARQLCMMMGRELTDLSFSDIARALGGKNHTTVLAACRKWQRLVRQRVEVSWLDRTTRRSLSADALLELLKERLRR